MKICDLYSALCERIPAELSAPWDNDGLMCSGDNEKEINKVLICLDVTDRVIDYAFDNGFDLIVSHHPMIFSPLKNSVLKTPIVWAEKSTHTRNLKLSKNYAKNISERVIGSIYFPSL